MNASLRYFLAIPYRVYFNGSLSLFASRELGNVSFYRIILEQIFSKRFHFILRSHMPYNRLGIKITGSPLFDSSQRYFGRVEST